jgi:glycosyltransferase involved in cell wall biosynthesis
MSTAAVSAGVAAGSEAAVRHVVELSYMYPSPRHPNSGVFIERTVRELARRVALDVVSPVPWAPPPLGRLSTRWAAYARQPTTSRCHGVTVHHPRYVQPVGRWALAMSGLTMAAGAGRTIARLVAERGAEVIHVHQLLPDGLAGVLLGRRLGRPVVCTLHGSDVTEAPRQAPFARAAARFVARRASAFTAASRNLVEALAEVAADHAPACVVPYGVDTAAFVPRDRAAVRRRLGLPADRPLVVYAGLLIARKGVDVLLDGFARLAAQRPDVELVVVGGSDERDDRRGALAERAARLGFGARVRFVGRQPHADMPLWLAAGDVFAFPSRLEGSPNVVREAIACGTPCVVSALPGIEDVVGPAQGLVVPMDDPAALGDALACVLDRGWDPAAVRAAADAWRWEETARRTLGVLHRSRGAAS